MNILNAPFCRISDWSGEQIYVDCRKRFFLLPGGTDLANEKLSIQQIDAAIVLILMKRFHLLQLPKEWRFSFIAGVLSHSPAIALNQDPVWLTAYVMQTTNLAFVLASATCQLKHNSPLISESIECREDVQ